MLPPKAAADTKMHHQHILNSVSVLTFILKADGTNRLYYLRILVVSRVLRGMCSERTVCFFTKYVVDC